MVGESLAVFAKAVPVAFAALMPVVNPIGTAIILLSMTEGADDKTRRQLARAIAVNAVVILFVVLLGGSYLLSFFGITVPIVQTAGGVVLAAMGWKLLNQSDDTTASSTEGVERVDPKVYFQRTFYPFTFPITVGPGSVAIALTLSAHTSHAKLLDSALSKGGSAVGILANGILVYLCFAYANRITARLGARGTSVLMRLMAFIVLCIGAQICWGGISALVTSLPPR